MRDAIDSDRTQTKARQGSTKRGPDSGYFVGGPAPAPRLGILRGGPRPGILPFPAPGYNRPRDTTNLDPGYYGPLQVRDPIVALIADLFV